MQERSTLTDGGGQAARLLTPLAQAIGSHVLRADEVRGDDTPIRALGGKGSKAKTGRLWVYERHYRLAGLHAPPAYGSNTHPAATSSTPQLTSSAGTASRRLTPSSAMVNSMSASASSRLRAGAMPDANCGITTNASTGCPSRWPTRSWSASPRSSRSSLRSGLARPCGAGGCGRYALSPSLKSCRPG